MTVTVRERDTQTPVPDAYVELRPLHLFSTEPPYDIVDFSPTHGSAGTTDVDGTVQVQCAADHPIDIHIVAAGFAPLHLTIVVKPDKPLQTWAEQRTFDDTTNALPALEVLVQP